ncbi:MAG: flagellar basal body rod C-terminal domain-containing protein, partial [Mariprofundales bacterium]|nr:flagellar basal body rod C-terminal domain-containing protein [Mariprofundales bacterium]
GTTTLSAAIIAATTGVGTISTAAGTTYTVANGGTPPASTGVVLAAGTAVLAGTTYPVAATLSMGNFAAGDSLSGTVTNATSSIGAVIFPPGTLTNGTNANLVAVTLPNDGSTTLRAAIAATAGVGTIATVAGTIYTVANGGSSGSVVGLINQAVHAYNHPPPPATAPTTPLSLTASTTGGVLKLDTGSSGQTLGFSGDTSNFLAAFEINSFFHGASAADLGLDSTVAANSDRINTGTINATTSAIHVGDSQVATSMFALQQTKLSIDGTTPASLHARNSNLSAIYGLDVTNAQRQQKYREAEFASLTSQRNGVSGVNIDEELVNMIKFQRAYQASAKIITTTNTMLDSLMGLIR